MFGDIFVSKSVYMTSVFTMMLCTAMFYNIVLDLGFVSAWITGSATAMGGAAVSRLVIWAFDL